MTTTRVDNPKFVVLEIKGFAERYEHASRGRLPGKLEWTWAVVRLADSAIVNASKEGKEPMLKTQQILHQEDSRTYATYGWLDAKGICHTGRKS